MWKQFCMSQITFAVTLNDLIYIQYYIEHQTVHSSERSFLCEVCGASFKTRSIQRKHIANLHQNPRAFLCHFCNKRFNTNYALRRHMKQHP
jgi:uncharacterized Zn-finger protein